MKKITGLLFVLLIATSIMTGCSCTSSHVWAASYDNGDGIVKIAVDSAGNIIVAGHSTILKYDSMGNKLWAIDKDGIKAMALDGSDNIYSTGYTGEEPDYNSYAFCTTKYDTDGNQIWEASFDGQAGGRDKATAIAVDESGNVYVTGMMLVSEGEIHYPDDVYDYATVKYDSAGNQVWVATYHGQDEQIGVGDKPTEITVDSCGDVYVTGHSNVTKESDTGCRYDCVIIKYNGMTGSEVWMKSLDNYPGDFPYYSEVIADNSGNIYVVGSFGAVKYNSQGEQIWASDESAEAEPVYDIAVDESDNIWLAQEQSIAKYDADGNELWLTEHDICVYDMDIDDNGNVYITGFRYTKDDTCNYYDCVTAAYNADGQRIWVTNYKGTGDGQSTGVSIAIVSSETVYVGASASAYGGYAILAYQCE